MTEPPGMFRRPSDPAEPLAPLRSSDVITTLHDEWAAAHAASATHPTAAQRLRRKARALTVRLGAGRDDALLGDLIRAIDAVTGRCDELSVRLHNLEITVDDLSRLLGEEVTRLRAAVEERTDHGAPESSPSRR